MSARRDLIVRALQERTADVEELTVEEIADVIEDTLLTIPASPYVATLRIARTPGPEELDGLAALAEELRAAGATAMLVLSDDASLALLDDEQLLRVGLTRVATTHRVPPGDSNVMPCCGRTPFEVPREERVTGDNDLVTCQGDNYCVRHGQGRWRCRLEEPAGACHVGEWPT